MTQETDLGALARQIQARAKTAAKNADLLRNSFRDVDVYITDALRAYYPGEILGPPLTPTRRLALTRKVATGGVGYGIAIMESGSDQKEYKFATWLRDANLTTLTEAVPLLPELLADFDTLLAVAEKTTERGAKLAVALFPKAAPPKE